MGTSQSSKGPNGKSPLIPPWADDTPTSPVPPSQERRHGPFRRALGQAVSGGTNSDYKKALGYYSRSSSGGGTSASRRLGSATTAGSQLFGFLSGNASISSGNSTVNLSDLNGVSCDEAISSITEILQTHDGDSEKIRNAMNEALTDALDGVDTFNEQAITDDVIITTMINYLSNMVFEQVVMDSNKAFNKCTTALQHVQAENALMELIKVIVDEKMTLNLSHSNDVQTLSNEQMKDIQRQTIIDVWDEWGSYNV